MKGMKVKAMKENDRLQALYVNERSVMLAWLACHVEGDEAEDILHDVMARAFGNLDALEPVRDIGAWLWRSLRNAVIDAWRSRKRRATDATPSDELDLLVDRLFPGVEESLERQELVETLYEAIDSLPREQREVIIEQSLKGMTFKAISQRTLVPVETLSARKRRALVRLGELLTASTGGGADRRRTSHSKENV
jgi:RNA polymerase sigma factor (sigma-70 family)